MPASEDVWQAENRVELTCAALSAGERPAGIQIPAGGGVVVVRPFTSPLAFERAACNN